MTTIPTLIYEYSLNEHFPQGLFTGGLGTLIRQKDSMKEKFVGFNMYFIHNASIKIHFKQSLDSEEEKFLSEMIDKHNDILRRESDDSPI